MDEKKPQDSKDINDISNRLMKNIEDGLNVIEVDITDIENNKNNSIDKDELEKKYQEATRNLKLDVDLIKEAYEDVAKKEHDKYQEEIDQDKENKEQDKDKDKDKDKDETIVVDYVKNVKEKTKMKSLDEIIEDNIAVEDDTDEETELLRKLIKESEEKEKKEKIEENKEKELNEDNNKKINEENESENDSIEEKENIEDSNWIVSTYYLIKDKIDSYFETRRSKKTHNGAMAKVLVAVSCVFFALIIYIVYYVMFDSKNRLNNPYNERAILMEETVLRGTIYSSDEKILAETINENNEWKRYYPYGNLFSHVVGRYDKGKTGIELGNDYDLLTTNETQIEKIINDINDKKSDGNSIVTTLDYKLQKVADKALGDRNGAVVAIEPSTGKILAMVSKPNYDPNYIAENWEKYSNADNSENALLNRATQGLYAPGSTFKLISALEYIRENNYADFAYECKGISTFDGHNTRCYNTQIHGVQNLENALINSCNTSFAQIGTQLDIAKFNKTCKTLMFNKDLPYDYNYKGSSFDLVKGSMTALRVDTAIGQGKTQITPFHNALITCAIANKGTLMKPYLVDKIVGSNMNTIKVISPKKEGELMTLREANILGSMMKKVAEIGTASALKNDRYTAAGKTGSAEYDETNNSHAWFVGYAPAENPKVVVSIIVEKAGTGGTYAVPIAKKIFDEHLK